MIHPPTEFAEFLEQRQDAPRAHSQVIDQLCCPAAAENQPTPRMASLVETQACVDGKKEIFLVFSKQRFDCLQADWQQRANPLPFLRIFGRHVKKSVRS